MDIPFEIGIPFPFDVAILSNYSPTPFKKTTNKTIRDDVHPFLVIAGFRDECPP